MIGSSHFACLYICMVSFYNEDTSPNGYERLFILDITLTIIVTIIVLLFFFLLLAALNIAAHAYIIKAGASYRKILGHTFLMMAIVLVLGLIFWSFIW
ncbi:hypothetical protein HUG20_05170 [Salicibibacter cibi]|uniref:Uncharacterized protein n=1 Tax=Salicibibacter cibi TaxID=2743001 RepID=A0A7T7CES0_9BACI|nr:hypothetical protein [Salicibibacter cibi]QQK79340.1 hypothetical protein HUG20_05170 [Salicibibacter cibi]